MPKQPLSQQTRSTQAWLKHSALPEQGCPFVSTHLPEPLQSCTPWQEGELSVWPEGTLVHVPELPATAHDLHSAVHPLSQHTPSTQKPSAHWLLPAHTIPSISFGTQVLFIVLQ